MMLIKTDPPGAMLSDQGTGGHKKPPSFLSNLHPGPLLPRLQGVTRVNNQHTFMPSEQGHSGASPESCQVEDVGQAGNHDVFELLGFEESAEARLAGKNRGGEFWRTHEGKEKGGDSRLLPELAS
jgi:hypothetical protein